MDHNEDKLHEAFGEWRAALRALLSGSSLTLDEKLRKDPSGAVTVHLPFVS
ncbi:hypothetical protein J2Y89_000276 [Curtobacterium herbarum]|nr:hypothetical protein [Curtobacterium herbarum]